MFKLNTLVRLALATVFSSAAAQAQQADSGSLGEMLAAQIRLQGFSCDRPLGTTMDAKRSRPDHGVWVLKCSNATYRVSRAPDMAAKVKQLR
jgi:hypothetical protein